MTTWDLFNGHGYPSTRAGRLAYLDTISLTKGTHDAPEDGLCVLEAAAYIAGLPHSDHPPCVSSVIAAFLRRWNDDLPDDATRDRLLKPLIPAILKTAGSQEIERPRMYRILDWLARTNAPAWCDLVPALSDDSAAIRRLPPITSAATARTVRERIAKVRDPMPPPAPRRESWEGMWSRVGDMTWDAAWTATRVMRWQQEWDRTWSAPWRLAGDAVWAALWDAPNEVALRKTAPIIEHLQESAVALIRELCLAS